MNHNFLPYEVCELLPQINPYNKIIENNSFHIRVSKNNCLFLAIESNTQESTLSAWTILDCLQWLEDEHEIDVYVNPPKVGSGWNYTVINAEGYLVAETNVNTRIQAYTEGIKEALKLIQT